MTPEQREELKQAAMKATPGPWRYIEHSWDVTGVYAGEEQITLMDIGDEATEENQDELEVRMAANAAFMTAANPAAILSLIAQVEAGNRKSLELQRVYDERGLQIERLEVALRRAYEAKIETQPAHEEIIRTGSMLMCTACGTISKAPAWEKLPEVYFDEDAAPTIPAIPGTKEGA